MKKRYILIIAFLSVAAWLGAQDEPTDSSVVAASPETEDLTDIPTDSLPVRAARLYQQNEYAQAFNLYKRITDAGLASPSLFYNMGNACFKQHDIKAAILYYERARRLAPNDEDINYNLGLCRSLIFDKVEAVPDLFLVTWIKDLRDLCSARAWSWMSIWCFVCTLLCGLAYLFVRKMSLKRTAFWLGALLLLFCIGTFTMGALQQSNVSRTDEAIVFTPSVTVKSSPDDSGNNLFVIHEGLKVTITDRIGGWSEIRIADGSKGWIRTKDMEVI